MTSTHHPTIPPHKAINPLPSSLQPCQPPPVTDSDPLFDIPSARGGRKRPSADLSLEIIRPLTEADLPKLQSPDPLNSKPIPLAALRASHHQLAQLLSQGRPETEISLLTGYSPSRISILKSDPTFCELVASYAAIRSQIFVDTLERMKILGLSTMDELQERLETAPEKWSNRELMEMANLMLIQPQKPSFGAGAGFAAAAGQAALGVAINVQFVKSDTPPLTIDAKPE